MDLQLKKIHHLIRYFILIGIAVFIGFIKQWNDQIVTYLIGPTMYLAHFVRDFVRNLVPGLPYETDVNYYGFLLPITIIYFGFIGTLLKILWNEYGHMRIPTLIAFSGFTLYIHYLTGKNLLGYLQVYP